MRRRFLVEQFESGKAFLRGDDARHLGRVLRAEPGQLYELSDGAEVWLAEAAHVERDSVEFTLLELLPAPRARTSVSLFLAIVKFDRFEWALEKATELGVDEIIPLAAERSEKGLLLAVPKRAERWRRILHESAQQARRVRVPLLRDAVISLEAFAGCRADVRVMLSERSGARSLRELLEPFVGQVSTQAPLRIALAIGPEGGWTEREFSAAAGAGFGEAALGELILRTETAVCAALAGVRYAFGAEVKPAAKSDSA
jgi:16S rRNA (uracil1498-N3)-methyltransferase